MYIRIACVAVQFGHQKQYIMFENYITVFQSIPDLMMIKVTTYFKISFKFVSFVLDTAICMT